MLYKTCSKFLLLGLDDRKRKMSAERKSG